MPGQWKTFPRAPEVEDIKELLALELTEDQPRNQCPWCGLDLQRSTSVHRKFCMKMPICMWLARQRATSRAYNEFGEGRPCSHCGSVYSEAHARARHEKQCGDRFAALGCKKSRGTSMGMFKKRSSLWVFHLVAQQGSHCGHTNSSEEHRIASRLVQSWLCGSGKMQASCLGRSTWVLHTNPFPNTERTSHGLGWLPCVLTRRHNLWTNSDPCQLYTQME